MLMQEGIRKMLMQMVSIVVCVLVCLITQAQHKWDGEGNDGEWMNPLNWETNTIPGATDEVVLDNSLKSGNYLVRLPAGALTVTIQRLIIDPAATDSIYLILPKENIAVPGLQINSTGYGLTLHERGVFINASGAGSGLPVMIADSIRINNGGRYVHRTGRSHAANIAVLSAAPGTEAGIFEFDIPDASGTISLSDRIFGSLMLSAVTAARPVNYTAAGTRSIRVRSNFTLNAGVALNLNFSDTFHIHGDFIQYASTFNCGTTARTLTILVYGNLLQFTGGVITESGTGLPEIVFAGSRLHQLRNGGNINNSIAMTVGSGDCMLQTSLKVPYSLRLISGRLYTTDTTLLILGAGCTIRADSAGGKSFVHGPMVKEGLMNEQFLFPVGKGIQMRWMSLKNLSGNVRVEFIQSNPQLLGIMLGEGIHHISSIEYWKISDHAVTGGNVELSFDNVNSGGVTELSSLRVAVYDSGLWHNAGNSFTTGNAGGAGSVVSDSIEEFGSGDRYFTLAAATSAQNPLPVVGFNLKGSLRHNHVLLSWSIQSDSSPKYFEIEGSADGLNFFKRGTVNYSGSKTYSFLDVANELNYYRLKANFNAASYYSDIIHVHRKNDVGISITPSVVRDFIEVKVSGQYANKSKQALIISSSGAVLKKLEMGNNQSLKIITSDLKAGLYYLNVMRRSVPFIKL